MPSTHNVYVIRGAIARPQTKDGVCVQDNPLDPDCYDLKIVDGIAGYETDPGEMPPLLRLLALGAYTMSFGRIALLVSPSGASLPGKLQARKLGSLNL